ncbi:MAG: metallophosphoesterase family protein [Bryobacteraceae bacterium]
MRTLIVSDLHANLYALDAVLAHASGGFDEIVCCGDLVGYNPHPAEVLEWTSANCRAVVRGNHDKAVAGIGGLEWFNEVAQAAALWTREHLSAEQLDYLRGLTRGPLALDRFDIWHGSPADEDEYVMNTAEARPCFQRFSAPLAFFGHTHLQGGFFSKYGRVGVIPQVKKSVDEAIIALEPDLVCMINPGSTGQPRDGDPRAAYAILDSEQRMVVLRRVEYPVVKTAEDIRRAGLPGMLAARLFHGA